MVSKPYINFFERHINGIIEAELFFLASFTQHCKMDPCCC